MEAFQQTHAESALLGHERNQARAEADQLRLLLAQVQQDFQTYQGQTEQKKCQYAVDRTRLQEAQAIEDLEWEEGAKAAQEERQRLHQRVQELELQNRFLQDRNSLSDNEI